MHRKEVCGTIYRRIRGTDINPWSRHQSLEPTSILGARSSVQMGLVTVDEQSVMKVDQSTLQMEDILHEYPEVFNGEFGCFAGELHLKVDLTVTPIQLPVRKMPLALKDCLKDELDRLQSIGVITLIEEPTDWVSCIIITPKPTGKLPVCLDLKPLNKGLKCSRYPMPTLDDILSYLVQKCSV